MNRIWLIALALIIIYQLAQRFSGGARISAKDLYALLQSDEDFTLVDVRTEGEFFGGHIAEAINIPVEYISTTRPASLDDLDEMIIVYCRSGARSRVAAKKLRSLGYTDVRDLGGLTFWRYGLVK